MSSSSQTDDGSSDQIAAVQETAVRHYASRTRRGTALSGASANAQRRLACPAAQDLDEMGGVRESRASSNLSRGQTIEER